MNWSFLVIILLVFGFILLLIEIFLIPGYGPAGIGAGVFLVIGIYVAWAKLSNQVAVMITLGSIFSVIIGSIIVIKSGYTKKMILKQRIFSYSNTKTINSDEITNKNISVGTSGVALSNLRPAGIAEFAHQRLNVLTDGTYIKSGARVKIIRIEGKKIFVEPV